MARPSRFSASEASRAKRMADPADTSIDAGQVDARHRSLRRASAPWPCSRRLSPAAAPARRSRRARRGRPTTRAPPPTADVAFFTTDRKLVPGDTDNRRDVYERSFDEAIGGYVTREVSTGPIGGNDAFDALFEKAVRRRHQGLLLHRRVAGRRRTPTTPTDIYMRDLETGRRRWSRRAPPPAAPAAGTAPPTRASRRPPPTARRPSSSPTNSSNRLHDSDGSVDVYMRDLSAGTTSLVSAGRAGLRARVRQRRTSRRPCAGSRPTARGPSSRPSSRSPAPTRDSAVDIYARDLPGGPTELVSPGRPRLRALRQQRQPNAVFAGSSSDGSKVFFETSEGLVPADTDEANDVYRRVGRRDDAGLRTGVSEHAGEPRPAASADGSKVFFVTAEPLRRRRQKRRHGRLPVVGRRAGTRHLGHLHQRGLRLDLRGLDGGRGHGRSSPPPSSSSAGDTDSSAGRLRAGSRRRARRCWSRRRRLGALPRAATASRRDLQRDLLRWLEGLLHDRRAAGPRGHRRQRRHLRPRPQQPRRRRSSSPARQSARSAGGCDALFGGASSDGDPRLLPDRRTADRRRPRLRTGRLRAGRRRRRGWSRPATRSPRPGDPGADRHQPRLAQCVDDAGDPRPGRSDHLDQDLHDRRTARGKWRPPAPASQLGGAGIHGDRAAPASTTSFRATATDENGDTSGCSGADHLHAGRATATAASRRTPDPPRGGTGSGGTAGSGGARGLRSLRRRLRVQGRRLQGQGDGAGTTT